MILRILRYSEQENLYHTYGFSQYRHTIFADIYANLPDMVNGYFDSLTAVIDQVAPIKTRLITIRPRAPWYTIDIDNEKKCRRRYERKWRRTKDPTDRNNYLEKCKHVNQMIHKSKSNFYSSVISENKGNQPAGTESELSEFYPISAKSVETIIRLSPSKCCTNEISIFEW